MTHTNNYPSHYDARKVPVEDVMQGMSIDLEQFYLGNVIKYLYRYPFKGVAIQDLIKARTYIDLLIEELTNAEENNNTPPWQQPLSYPKQCDNASE